MTRDRRNRQPTCTSIVITAMTAANDYVTAAQLVELTRLTSNQVTASLANFKRVGAAECFESGGKLWWYPTPETDRRLRTVDQIQSHITRHRRVRTTTKGEKKS